METVSWDDCQIFIDDLNSQSGSVFRLPTEAEWEYAARSGGREEKYAGGDDLNSLGWYYINSGGHTHEAGTKAANGLGIYDMSGNVYEWCSDWYVHDYYSSSPRDNPQGPSSGSSRGSGRQLGLLRAGLPRGESERRRAGHQGRRLRLPACPLPRSAVKASRAGVVRASLLERHGTE